MNHILSIDIQKNKEKHVIWCDKEQVTIEDILSIIRSTHVTLLHVQTYENGVCLLNGYVPYRSNAQLRQSLGRAAKAQI